MKKTPTDPEMLQEYDISGGTRGKYAAPHAEGTNVVVIDPDVAEFFPDHDSVNEALRGLAAILKSKSGRGPKQGPSRSASPDFRNQRSPRRTRH